MKKDLLLLFALVVIVAVLLTGTDFQTVEEYYLEHAEDVKPGEPSVTVSIRCDTLTAEEIKADPALTGLVPLDGILLSPTVYALREGDTAFSLLQRATASERIQMEYLGSGMTVYVQGIGYLYELAYGELSGWMFCVNGSFPQSGAASYRPSDGDRLEWIYSRALGRDIDGTGL